MSHLFIQHLLNIYKLSGTMQGILTHIIAINSHNNVKPMLTAIILIIQMRRWQFWGTQ